MSCEMELCPFWGGDGCVCDVMDISDEEREAEKQRLESW